MVHLHLKNKWKGSTFFFFWCQNVQPSKRTIFLLLKKKKNYKQVGESSMTQYLKKKGHLFFPINKLFRQKINIEYKCIRVPPKNYKFLRLKKIHVQTSNHINI